ncbi:MAG: histidinol-phosphatase [Fibrella sp.]|nr:histidinol-phosphatase [Armatimonadota bacterium]
MTRFDYHSHHYRCGHASGGMRDYIEAALALEMTSFGVADHGPAYWVNGIDHAYPLTQMAVSELPVYVAEARALQSEFGGRIDVRVGLEADFVPGRAADLAELLSANSFDYVLGSVHYVLGRSVFDRARWRQEDPVAVWREYYKLVIEAAQSGLFDILSHLTVVEAYSPPVPDALTRELYPPVAEAVASAGCAVEINTSGYRKMPPGPDRSGDEPFPNRVMLRELIRCGVPLTFGSDCHKPDDVGFGHERVMALLAELGVDTQEPVAVRIRREPIGVYRTA